MIVCVGISYIIYVDVLLLLLFTCVIICLCITSMLFFVLPNGVYGGAGHIPLTKIGWGKYFKNENKCETN